MEPLPILAALIAALVPAASSITAVVRFITQSSKKNKEADVVMIKPGEDQGNQHIEASILPNVGVIRTVQQQLNQLNDYYNMNKRQANYSFNASISAVILGFITIISGIWFYYFKSFLPSIFSDTLNITITAVSVISGILTQLVGASYFIMYRTSIQQVNYFFNQLVVMQDTMLAIELARDLPNEGKLFEQKQVALTEEIILSVLERSSKLERKPPVIKIAEEATRNTPNRHKNTLHSSTPEDSTKTQPSKAHNGQQKSTSPKSSTITTQTDVVDNEQHAAPSKRNSITTDSLSSQL